MFGESVWWDYFDAVLGGFSIGIDDVQPGDNLYHNTNKIISQGNKKCDNFIPDLIKETSSANLVAVLLKLTA